MGKFLFVFLSFSLLFALPIFGQNQTLKLRDINQKIEKNNALIEKKRSQEKKIVTELGTLSRDLRLEKSRLQRTRNELVSHQRSLNTTQSELRSIESDYSRTMDFLGQRLRSAYMHSDLGFLSFLFSPDDYMGAINQSYYFDRVMKADIAIVEKARAQKKRLSQKKYQLDVALKRISSTQKTIASKTKTIQRQTLKYKNNLSSLRDEIAKFEHQNAVLKQNSREIGNLIRSDSSPVKTRKFYGNGSYIKPAKGWISSRYGYRTHPIFKRRILHSGVDIAAPRGYEIRATTNGYVLFSGWQKGYGNLIILDHGWKGTIRYSTIYAHQHRLVVRKGQYVKQGQLIGYVGSTGYSTGPHLHFELRHNGKPVDPFRYMKW